MADNREQREKLERKKAKKRANRETKMIIDGTLTTLERMFERNFKTDDPVIRHTLFLEKLYSMLDISFGFAEVAINKFNDGCKDEDDKISTAYIARNKKLISSIQNEMNLLNEWVQSPIYGPDHPIGVNLMMAAKNHHDSILNGFSSNGKSKKESEKKDIIIETTDDGPDGCMDK